jgi:hypothetical protein
MRQNHFLLSLEKGVGVKQRAGTKLQEKGKANIERRLLEGILAGEEGFEPSLAEPESAVLPLDDSPAHVAL